MVIRKVMEEIHQNNVKKGFWDIKETKNIGELLMLCVSELSEALEAHRKKRFSNLVKFETEKIINTSPEMFNREIINTSSFEENIKDTFEDEIADTVIRLFDLCEGFDIDLETHIRLKIEYNKTRPFKHNKAY